MFDTSFFCGRFFSGRIVMEQSQTVDESDLEYWPKSSAGGRIMWDRPFQDLTAHYKT